MADRRIRVVVDADETGDFNSTARGLDDVASSGDRADASLRKLTKGHQALDAEISKVASSAKALRSEFEKSGDIGLLGDIDKQERQLAKLRKQLASFGDDSDVRGAGARIGEGLVTSISDTITKNPFISTAIIGGIAAGAPAITAVVSGALGAAVLLGLGGGIIATGISAASHDARVSDAWGEIFIKAGERLDRDSDAFVEPLIRGAGKVGDAFDRLFPTIDKGFQSLVPSIDDLTTGLAGLIDKIASGPGLDKALLAAKPFIDTLADELPQIGAAIDSFLGHIANAGPGARAFFEDLLTLVEQGIRALGWLIEKGSQLYEVFVAIGQAVTGHFADAFQTILDIGDNTAKSFGGFRNTTIDVATAFDILHGNVLKTAQGTIVARDNFAGMMQILQQTVVTADTVAGTLAGRMLSSMLSLDQATLGFVSSQTQLTEAIKTNGRETDIHSAKGQANRQAILGAVSANIQQHAALIQSGASAQFAAAQYDVNTQALEDQLRQAGFTQGAIDGLIGKYRGVPKNVNTQIAIEGLTKAISQLDETLRLINGLHDRTVTVTSNFVQRFTTIGTPTAPLGGASARVNRYGGVYEKAATGLLREAAVYSSRNPGRYMIAEPGTRGEAFVPKSGDYGRSMSILNKAASWYGASVVPRSGYASSVSVGNSGGSRTYQINVTVAPGANPADAGAAAVAAIKAYEKQNGSSWRS